MPGFFGASSVFSLSALPGAEYQIALPRLWFRCQLISFSGIIEEGKMPYSSSTPSYALDTTMLHAPSMTLPEIPAWDSP